MGEQEPGLRPLSAALEEEGFEELGSGRLLESFARHLMVVLDACQESGFDVAAKSCLARLSPEKGTSLEIGETGDLLIRRRGSARLERRALAEALAQPSWLDPMTGGPRR
jgi:hypothetical protein